MLTIHPGKKKSADGLMRSRRPSKAGFFVISRLGTSIGGIFEIRALFFSGVGGWILIEWLSGEAREPDSRTLRTREDESGQIADQATTKVTSGTAGLPDSLNSLKKKKY